MREVSNPESSPHVLWSLFISCSINGSCAAVAAGGQSVRILGGEAWSDWTASELSKGDGGREKKEKERERERWTLQLTVSRTAKVKGFYETLGFHSHRQVCVCVLLPNLPWSHNAAQERDLCRAHHGRVNKGSRKASLTTKPDALCARQQPQISANVHDRPCFWNSLMRARARPNTVRRRQSNKQRAALQTAVLSFP